MLTSPIRKPIRIDANWDGKCADCGLEYAAGSKVIWTPQPSHLKGSRLSKSHCTHADGCGSSYIVHLIYRSSRKQVSVAAWSAQDAVERAVRKCLRSAVVSAQVLPQVRGSYDPVGFPARSAGFTPIDRTIYQTEVYQGSVRVL